MIFTNGKYRAPSGNLYEIERLSSLVHIVLLNGVQVGNWVTSIEAAEKLAAEHYSTTTQQITATPC
jgi:hypothetical protein